MPPISSMVLARPPLALRPRSYEDLALTNYSGPSWSSYPSHHISRWTPGLAELAGRGGILDEGHIARLVRSSPLIRGPLPIAPSRLENAIFDILAVGEHEENEASKHLLLTNMLNKLRLADMHRPLRSVRSPSRFPRTLDLTRCLAACSRLLKSGPTASVLSGFWNQHSKQIIAEESPLALAVWCDAIADAYTRGGEQVGCLKSV